MSMMPDLFRAAPHVRLHRGRTMVIKVGGGSLAGRAALERFARQIGVVHAFGARVVVVHGAGPQIDAVQRAFGETPRMVDGRRVTGPGAIRALRMVAAGELNSELVAALGAEDVPAVGVSGSSAGLLVARRRPPVETSEGVVDFGHVGDLVQVDPKPLLALLDAGFLPVVAPPAGDGKGGFLNVNADVTAAALAGALAAAKLVLLTGAPGVLRDPDDPRSLLSALSLAELDALEAGGAFRGGMKVKAAAIRQALEAGVERVHVVSGSDPDALLRELYTNHGAGTLVTRLSEEPPAEDDPPKSEGAPGAHAAPHLSAEARP
jgi:acetylglutamate kinase